MCWPCLLVTHSRRDRLSRCARYFGNTGSRRLQKSERQAYPFRYKPQDLNQAPRIYAPYQPRFDWNLWFASLGSWRENLIVPSTEERLLAGSPDVLALFAGNPFPKGPPKQVRAVLWQYWFTPLTEKRAAGLWWRRELLGLYAPVLEREPDGKIVAVQWPEPLRPHL